jgi:protein O-GlcNAc transferase
MYHKAQELSEALAYKEGLARAYGNLGIINFIRGDLRQAEIMYHKAQELSGLLDYKESIAKAYLNLGLVYEERGKLTQAEAMYRIALTRFQELGATSRVATVRTSLERVRMQCLPFFGFSLHSRW